jgi:arylsulfatase A-like enzyme
MKPVTSRVVCLFLLLPALTVPSTAADAAASQSQLRPNIVLIMSDDQGWGDLSLHGNTNLATPHVDSLARDGALFSRFYVSPVCAPTRASLLTGRYHPRTGVHGVSRGRERMNLGETTIAEILRRADYTTAAFGKWHNGSQYPYHPNGRGFDEFYGFCCGHWGNYFNPQLDHNGQEVHGSGFIINDLTDHALDWIEFNQTRPFFCYVPYNTPHSPFQVPDIDFNRVKDRQLTLRNRDPGKEELPKTRAALALCENIDHNVGRILQRIDKLGLRDRTIVVYLSDNGPNSWRWNGGMKGRKGSVDEGGVRVPMLIRWPGHIPPGLRIDRIASHIDLLPTLLDLVGLPVPPGRGLLDDEKTAPTSTDGPHRTAERQGQGSDTRTASAPLPIDGMSLKPLLEGDCHAWPDRMIFSTYNGRVSVRTQRYRAAERTLFDMVEDPGQQHNLASTRFAVHALLASEIRAFRAEVLNRPPTRRPYPVGYREFPLTVLPAQDGQFEGTELLYSSRHPNASWMTGWTSTAAYPYWDVEVHTAGTYEVSIKYTCAAEDIGAVLQFELLGQTLRGKVTEAFDPPLTPAPDRVPRGESYDKPFATLQLGNVDLPTGRGKLVLRAVSKPGRHIVDLRQVQLELRKDPNVLFIAIDDLNDWTGLLRGHPQARTPNIDRLAKRGVLFTNAHCAAPACNPSRAALMTGVPPFRSGVYHNPQPWRKALPNAVTIPQYFTRHGYWSAGSGKIFHGGFPDPASWDAYWPSKTRPQFNDPRPPKANINGLGKGHFDWGPVDVADAAMGDAKTVDWICQQLGRQHDKPIFLACGLYRPHLPWYVPRKYFDMFPVDSIELPKVLANDLDDIPPTGVAIAKPKGDHAAVVRHGQWKLAVQGYLASIAFADTQVGRVIDALDQSPNRSTTIVVLWTDHGWHLGEKEHWRKFALWEEATRTPLIMIVPPATSKVVPNGTPIGVECGVPVSLMDLYPTLVELCSLPQRPDIAGRSLVPLLVDPTTRWDRAVVTTFGRGNHAVRGYRWRYIRYKDGRQELYDHQADPSEWHNLADSDTHRDVIERLAKYLPKDEAAEAARSKPRSNKARQKRPRGRKRTRKPRQ